MKKGCFIIQDPGGRPDWKVPFDELIKHQTNRGGTVYAIEFPMLRTWNFKDGKKTEGEWLGYLKEENRVRLKTADGRTVEVPVERLSDSDQQFIERLK